MGLRILGAAFAVLIAAFAQRRYSRGQLRRGELFLFVAVVVGLSVAALAPALFDPLLDLLGFKPGNQRRLIVLLALSQMFTLTLLLRALARDDSLADEIGRIVDYGALRRLDAEGWKPMSRGCAVVIPAYNEADNLPDVLAEVPKEVAGLPVETIVIADGCTDGTEEVARQHGATVIQRDLRRGQGAATRLGYVAALKAGASVVVTMDADGQHDPREMESLVAPVVEGRAEMVQGSRVLGHFEVESKIRKKGVQFFSRVLTFLSRTPITDPANGYRAVLTETLRRLDLRQDQFLMSELILDAAHKGLRVVEVPITVRKRVHGATKKGTTWRYALGFSRGVVGTWLRQRSGRKPLSLEPQWLDRSGAPPADLRVAINGSKARERARTTPPSA